MLCARCDPKFLDAGLLRRLQAQQRQDSTDSKTRSHAGGLRILFRSRLFRRLTVCLMVSGIVTDGLSDLLIQYFKLLFNFTVRDVVRFQHLLQCWTSSSCTPELLCNFIVRDVVSVKSLLTSTISSLREEHCEPYLPLSTTPSRCSTDLQRCISLVSMRRQGRCIFRGRLRLLGPHKSSVS